MTRLVAWSFALVLLCASPVLAQVPMPASAEIAGRAIPAPELRDGTVSVRVLRERLGANISGVNVTVTAAAITATGTTDTIGRAQFAGLSPGTSARAVAVVNGERLTSRPFEVPRKGGIRVILIAGLPPSVERREKERAAANVAATTGPVAFGGRSRIVLEFEDDALQVIYHLDLVNSARARVDAAPIVLDLPPSATGATLLDGSTAAASVRADRVVIAGPFPPGTTPVHVAFRLPVRSDMLTLAQRWPVPLQQVAVAAEKLRDLRITSPQFHDRGEARAADGTGFMTARGPGVPAGEALTLEVTGLPVHSRWPVHATLGLAAVVMGFGILLAARAPLEHDNRMRLEARRESLYDDLVTIEAQHRSGHLRATGYRARRDHLLSELELVYRELDRSFTLFGEPIG